MTRTSSTSINQIDSDSFWKWIDLGPKRSTRYAGDEQKRDLLSTELIGDEGYGLKSLKQQLKEQCDFVVEGTDESAFIPSFMVSERLGSIFIEASGGADFITLVDGNDAIFLGDVDNVINNGDQQYLSHSSGFDYGCGGGGNDYIIGGSGIQLLCGQNGSDFLYGGQDNDVLIGGAEADTFMIDLSDKGADLIMDLTSQGDKIVIMNNGSLSKEGDWYLQKTTLDDIENKYPLGDVWGKNLWPSADLSYDFTNETHKSENPLDEGTSTFAPKKDVNTLEVTAIINTNTGKPAAFIAHNQSLYSEVFTSFFEPDTEHDFGSGLVDTVISPSSIEVSVL